MNPSYVLISIILSNRLRTDESTSPNYLGKYIILFLFFIYLPENKAAAVRYGFFIN